MSEDDTAPLGYWAYGWEKCKRQPFVPIGIIVTCGALLGASTSLRKGNREQFNKYLRLRVAAQGVTVIAAVAGTFLLTNKSQEVQDRRTRAITNQLPLDPDSETYSRGSYPSSSSSTLSKQSPSPIAAAASAFGSNSSSSSNNPAQSGSGTGLAAPSVQTHSPNSSNFDQNSLDKSRYSRPPRVSQVMAETEKSLSDDQASGGGAVLVDTAKQRRKQTDFQRRLEMAERLQEEQERKYGPAKTREEQEVGTAA